ncbi:DUF2610 domain-containing protein [Pseudomonas koreensis]
MSGQPPSCEKRRSQLPLQKQEHWLRLERGGSVEASNPSSTLTPGG